MQLRAHTRRPGKYREDDIPPLPGTAKFVHPTTPYNPNLPPAAFPTLDVSRSQAPPSPSPPLSEPMDVDGLEISDSLFEGEFPQRPAAVFRGKSKAPTRLPPDMIQHEAEVEKDRQEPEEGLSEPKSPISSGDPGEFAQDGCCFDIEEQDKIPRMGLPAYDQLDDWKHITDGLKLIILSELMKSQSFQNATEILILSEDEIEEMYNLHEQEAIRQAEEDARIVKAQARQLEALTRGVFATDTDKVSTLFADYFLADMKNSTMFVFSRKEIQQAQRFLNGLKLFECAHRLWRYHGVAIVPDLVCMRTSGPSSLSWSSGRLGDQQYLQALQPCSSQKINQPKPPEIETEDNRKRKQRTLNGKQLLLASQGRKKPRNTSQIVKMKVPASGLRNVITADEQEETMGTTPAALRESLLLQLPVPPPPKLPETSPNFGTPKFMFEPFSRNPSPSASPPRQVPTPSGLSLAILEEQTSQGCCSAKEELAKNQLPSQIQSKSSFLTLTSRTYSAELTPSKLLESPKVRETLLLSVGSLFPLYKPLAWPGLKSQVSCAKTASIPLKSPEQRNSSTESLLPLSKPQMAPSNTVRTLFAIAQPHISPADGRLTLSEPQMSPKVPKSPLTCAEPPSTPSRLSWQQTSPFSAQPAPSKPRKARVTAAEFIKTLSEKAQLRTSPAEADLKLFTTSSSQLVPAEAPLAPSRTQTLQVSPAEARLPPSRTPKASRTPKPQLSSIEAPSTPVKSKKQQKPPSELQLTLLHSRKPNTSSVGSRSTPSKSPKLHQSPAKKRFAIVAKHLGIDADLDGMARAAIELGTPFQAAPIATPEKLSVGRILSTEKAAGSIKAPLSAHAVTPASPDPLTGEVQTREPVRRSENASHIKTLARAAFDIKNIATEEPVTPTKKPKDGVVTQKRGTPPLKAVMKGMSGIAKEEVTTRAPTLEFDGNEAATVATSGTAKARDKINKGSKAVAAKLKGTDLMAQIIKNKNTIDKKLPKEGGLPCRKRKRLHDPNDDPDL